MVSDCKQNFRATKRLDYQKKEEKKKGNWREKVAFHKSVKEI